MKKSELNNIGLDINDSKQVAEKLNDLLSNYQQFYMNLRGFHWNIKGKKFFELHLKFEELYNNALEKVDEIFVYRWNYHEVSTSGHDLEVWQRVV